MATLSVSDYSPFKLGQTRDVALVSSSRGNRDATLAMLLQTRRTVDIFSRDLDRAIYDDHEIVQSIRALVVGSRRARVRVLVRTSSLAVTQGHRLVHVAQRLSTFVQIRKVANEHRTYNSGLFIADSMETLIRRFADRYEGEACFTNPIQARDYGRLFNDMWAISVEDPSLRSLHI